MTQKLALTRDINGFNTFGIAPSDVKVGVQLIQNDEESFQVPTAFKFYELVFSIDPGLRVWVSYDGATPDVPSSTFATINSELNPAARTVPGGTIVNCITPDTSAFVGVMMYGIP